MFMVRYQHPNLTLCTPQLPPVACAAAANMETIPDFFGKLGAICVRIDLLTKRNVDETDISVVHKSGKLLGKENMWGVTSAEKGTHTV